jgi:hypothetical protein
VSCCGEKLVDVRRDLTIDGPSSALASTCALNRKDVTCPAEGIGRAHEIVVPPEVTEGSATAVVPAATYVSAEGRVIVRAA